MNKQVAALLIGVLVGLFFGTLIGMQIQKSSLSLQMNARDLVAGVERCAKTMHSGSDCAEIESIFKVRAKRCEDQLVNAGVNTSANQNFAAVDWLLYCEDRFAKP
jgi:hypothetical protein